MPSDRPLKILVIGCGSIGRRHIRLLKEMGVDARGFDVDLAACHRYMDEFEALPYRGDLSAVLEFGFDGAIIATPNHLHREPAEECLRAGLPVLIEKPMCHTLEEADVLELLHHVRPHPLLVGYSLRFHPGLRRVKELLDSGTIGKVRHASIHFGSYLPDWRPGFDYRQGYAARRETGGGILLDASHELDYACWLFGRPVSVMAQVQNSGALEIETEDIADVAIRFESGMQAAVHMDYLNTTYARGCTVVGDDGTLRWSMEPGHSAVVVRYPKAACAPASWDLDSPDDMYRAELKHFLACIRGEERPLVTGEDGIRALRLVEAAQRSSAEGRTITL